jgi:hypothetical protein
MYGRVPRDQAPLAVPVPVACPSALPEESVVGARRAALICSFSRINTPIPLGQAGHALPHVMALRTNGTSSASVGDDRLGAHLATRHLLDLGHRRIGLVRGPSYASTSRDREVGYRDALAEAGVPVDDTLLAGDSFSMQAGELAGRTLLDRTDRPTAIFAINDNTAIGVMAAAHALGLRPRRPVRRRLQRHPRRQPAPGAAHHRPRTLPANRRERPRTSARSRQRQPAPHRRCRANTHPTQVNCRLHALNSCGSTRWRLFGMARIDTSRSPRMRQSTEAPPRRLKRRLQTWTSDCHRRCPLPGADVHAYA